MSLATEKLQYLQLKLIIINRVLVRVIILVFRILFPPKVST